jgi:hypothetical protein
MDATALTALVLAVNRDDRERCPPDGPWAVEAPYRPQGRKARSIVAGRLLGAMARVVRRRREATTPLAPVTTN